MHTPIEFDYDLWTTEENGQKHYWARVKRTGEVTEISHDVIAGLHCCCPMMFFPKCFV